MASVLASPPKESCCGTGFLHSGTPKGEIITLAGLQTYVSHPPKPSDKLIIFLPDVHGPFHINNQLLMDTFASKGFLIVAVDYFEGDPVHLARERSDFDWDKWMDFSLTRAKKTTPAWIDATIQKYATANTKIGTVGYCFGAPFVLDICATDRVKAGAIAHPAFLDEDHFKKVKQPVFISCAEDDVTYPTDARHSSEKILAGDKKSYHFQVFSGVSHGFALRGNMEVENERWAKEESCRGIVGWWNRFLV